MRAVILAVRSRRVPSLANRGKKMIPIVKAIIPKSMFFFFSNTDVVTIPATTLTYPAREYVRSNAKNNKRYIAYFFHTGDTVKMGTINNAEHMTAAEKAGSKSVEISRK